MSTTRTVPLLVLLLCTLVISFLPPAASAHSIYIKLEIKEPDVSSTPLTLLYEAIGHENLKLHNNIKAQHYKERRQQPVDSLAASNPKHRRQMMQRSSEAALKQPVVERDDLSILDDVSPRDTRNLEMVEFRYNVRSFLNRPDMCTIEYWIVNPRGVHIKKGTLDMMDRGRIFFPAALRGEHQIVLSGRCRNGAVDVVGAGGPAWRHNKASQHHMLGHIAIDVALDGNALETVETDTESEVSMKKIQELFSKMGGLGLGIPGLGSSTQATSDEEKKKKVEEALQNEKILGKAQRFRELFEETAAQLSHARQEMELLAESQDEMSSTASALQFRVVIFTLTLVILVASAVALQTRSLQGLFLEKKIV